MTVFRPNKPHLITSKYSWLPLCLSWILSLLPTPTETTLDPLHYSLGSRDSPSPLPCFHQDSLQPHVCAGYNKHHILLIWGANSIWASRLSCWGCLNEMPYSGGASTTDIYFTQFWTLEGRVKVPAGVMSGEVPPQGWQMTFSLCALVASLCLGGALPLSRERNPLCLIILPDQDPILTTSFNLHYFLRGPISKHSYSRG